jgi:hypothetical protein
MNETLVRRAAPLADGGAMLIAADAAPEQEALSA